MVQRSILATRTKKKQTPTKEAKNPVDSIACCVDDWQYCCDAA
jgi:hypothetical protein